MSRHSVATTYRIRTLLLLLLLFINTFTGAAPAKSKDDDDAQLLLSYFAQIPKANLNDEQRTFVTKCASGDIPFLYRAAHQLLTKEQTFLGTKNVDLAMAIYTYLGETKEYGPALGKLGTFHANGDMPEPPFHKRNTNKAMYYYQKGGLLGHHPSLYNAGKLLAEGMTQDDVLAVNEGNANVEDFVTVDLVGSLMYLQAAATLHNKLPDNVETNLIELSQRAHESVCNVIPNAQLDLKQSADAFLFGTTKETTPDVVETEWKEAIDALIQFNETFVKSDGSIQHEPSMMKATKHLKNIIDKYADTLSPLQLFIALDNLNDMLGPLAGLDDTYVADAALYAEALASTPLCYNYYARTESESGCFNGAASSAISYYRRNADLVRAERVRELGVNHEGAATHWTTTLQTPRVYHRGLTAEPWWDPMEFSAPRVLKQVYGERRNEMLKELTNVIQLQEGMLRTGGVEEMDVDVHGRASSSSSGTAGIKRIFTPYIGVRTKNTKTRIDGAGGWAEYGPLYDGTNWNEDRCNVVPTICNALRNDPSLCTARKSSSGASSTGTAFFTPKKSVTDLCGSNTIVTLLRLRPGTSILPHCGTTNARLIMHFPLVGAENIRFVVGGKTVMNYNGGNGHPIVFDDSFEHHVYHEGNEDRYVVLVVLGHPDLMG